MSDKKIINMDDLMVDNLSLDNLVSLPNTPDAASDWKHKGNAEAPTAPVNSVDDLDISSVDLSVLDPEREVSESTYRGNTYFTSAPEETESSAPAPAPAAPVFTPPTGGITVEKIVPPAGGIEVQKVSPAAPTPAYTPPKPAPVSVPDPLDGLGLDLPPLKKVSLETELPPIKPVTPENTSVPLTPVTPVTVPKAAEPLSAPSAGGISVDIPGLPPKPASVSTADTELPPIKPHTAPAKAVNVDIPDLPPLKPADTKKEDSGELPPMKRPVTVGKKPAADSDLPPLKPIPADKKEDGGLPPMKPISVDRKGEEAHEAEEDADFVKPHNKHDDEPPLPSDMSDVVAPKLDDMMEIKGKIADFQRPENAVNGGENPFANTNMSAARRKKLEEGFDAPIVMKQVDAATMQELRNQEQMDRAAKGKTDVLVIAIIYIVLCSAGLVSNLNTRSVISFAIDILFAVLLSKGAKGARFWYILGGIGTSVMAWIGIAALVAIDAGGLISLTVMGWITIITAAAQSLFLLVSAIMLFASKNINAYFDSL